MEGNNKMIKLDHDDILGLEKYYRANLINKIAGYKTGNLIATKSKDGIINVAVFNSVVHIGANPPYLGFIMRPLTVERQTYDNLKDLGFYTINGITTEIVAKAHQSSAKYDNQTSEFNAVGFSEEYHDDFPVPFVGESNIKLGMSYKEEYEIKANGTILIIGKIEKIILPDNSIKEDGDLELEKLNSVAIGGLDTYYKAEKIARYEYARAGQDPKEI